MLVESEIKNLREENSKLKQEVNFYKQQCQRIDTLIREDKQNPENLNPLDTIINTINKIENPNSSNNLNSNSGSKSFCNREQKTDYDVTDLIYLKQQMTISEQKFQMEAMKEEFLVKEIAMRREFDMKKAEYESKISNLVSKLDLLEHKNDVFMKYETYMKELEKYNKDLIKNISELQTKYDIDMEEGKRNLNFKVDKVKKKMLNLINVTKSHFKSMIDNQVEYNSKILLLQNTQLFEELAEQSKHLEELHIKLKEKEKQIIGLKLDLEIQREVQVILSGNNKKITDLIKCYFEEKDKTDDNNIKNDEYDKLTHKTKDNYNKSELNLTNIKNNKHDNDSNMHSIKNEGNVKTENNQNNSSNNDINHFCVCDCFCNCYFCSKKNKKISEIFAILTTENTEIGNNLMTYLVNQSNNNRSELNIIQSSPKIEESNFINNGKSNKNLVLKNQNILNLNNSIINNQSTKDKSFSKNFLNKKSNCSNLINNKTDIEVEKYKLNVISNENESKVDLTEQEKYYANYKKNFVLTKIKNFNTVTRNTDDDNIPNDSTNRSEEKKFKNKLSNTSNTNFFNHRLNFNNNLISNNKNLSNFSTIDLNTDRTHDRKFEDKMKLDNIYNLNRFEKGENRNKISSINYDNPNPNPSSSNSKNLIIDKVKKQISKFNYDKIFDALNLKTSKRKGIMNYNDIFIGTDTLKKKKNFTERENRIYDVNKNKFKTNFSLNKNLDASNDLCNNSNNLIEKKLKNKLIDKSHLLFSDFYESKMEEFSNLHLKSLNNIRTKPRDQETENIIQNNVRKLSRNNLSILINNDNQLENYNSNEKNNDTNKIIERNYYTIESTKDENKILFKSNSKIIFRK